MVEIIAIDGPASVGKSSIAKKISKYYDSPLLNSGRLYRAIALKIINKKININDKKKIIEISKLLTYKDIHSNSLFTGEIDKVASKISSRQYLRDQLVSYQKEFPHKYAKGKKYAIIEGRDIGTEIFPQAKFKFFMWADARIRAKRRFQQIKKNGKIANLSIIYKEIVARDTKDINRNIAPLRPAVNSVLLDTSYLDIEQAFNAIKKIIDQVTYETRIRK